MLSARLRTASIWTPSAAVAAAASSVERTQSAAMGSRTSMRSAGARARAMPRSPCCRVPTLAAASSVGINSHSQSSWSRRNQRRTLSSSPAFCPRCSMQRSRREARELVLLATMEEPGPALLPSGPVSASATNRSNTGADNSTHRVGPEPTMGRQMTGLPSTSPYQATSWFQIAGGITAKSDPSPAGFLSRCSSTMSLLSMAPGSLPLDMPHSV
mmetsp:Transcript_29213/g.43308  ORF Transcript_29213/g.43308 Transcript_29213/m.43308 type:complete len:214 (+) Transcript_29213:157-798(+)